MRCVRLMEHETEVRETLEYIEKNLRRDVSLDELAKTAFLSKYHYHRLFHKIVGDPVKKYIRKRRMESAAEELITTEKRIIDIAFLYQFSSQESFSRAFKDEYGISPGGYRRRFMKYEPSEIKSKKAVDLRYKDDHPNMAA